MHEPAAVELARFIHGVVDTRELPDDLRITTREAVADTCAVSFGARGVETLTDLASWMREGDGPARDLLGRDSSTKSAAFVNGLLAHGLDYDDTHFPSVLHPSAVVVPVLLAHGSHSKADGAAFMAAVAAGREVAIRLGLAGYDPARRVSVYLERGFHASALCGGIAAAGALAAIQGAGVDVVAHAMSIAASMVGGTIEANRSGGTVKPFHNAWASAASVVAVQLALRGVTGPATSLDGQFGFLSSHVGVVAERSLWLDDLALEWHSAQTYTKLFPANHFLHAAIDCGIGAYSQGVRPSQIQAARLGLPSDVVGIVGEPIEQKRAPRTPYEAKFSAQFCVAAALTLGRVTLEEFSIGALGEISQADLIRRIEVGPDPEASELFPMRPSARLEVQLIDGKTSSIWIDQISGGPDNRPTRSQTLAKLTDCLALGGVGVDPGEVNTLLLSLADGSTDTRFGTLLDLIGNG